MQSGVVFSDSDGKATPAASPATAAAAARPDPSPEPRLLDRVRDVNA